jgi:hypothetical protein
MDRDLNRFRFGLAWVLFETIHEPRRHGMIAGAAAAQMARQAMTEETAARTPARATRPARPGRLRAGVAVRLRAVADRLEPTGRTPERA